LIGFLSIVALGITARVQGAPALFWLGGIPLLPVALDRPKAGYVWTVISVCLIGTFWIFSAPGVELQADSPGSHWHSLNALSQTGLLVFSLAVGVSLESSRARAFQELTETNRELAQSRLLAQRASEAKSVFIAHMSHEIRTPMTGVAGMAEALLDLELSGTQREYAENIASSADSLLGVLNAILDVSKLEAGELGLERLPVSFEELVREIHRFFGTRATSKGLMLDLVNEIDESRKFYRDPLRIRQVLINLVDNALKFTERGTVSVQVSAHPRDASSWGIEIAVGDTGIGIAPECLSGVFERFVQVDSSMARRFGGTGLGLTISRSLVELMGGRIEVASELGVGTRFSVSLVLDEAIVDDTQEAGPPGATPAAAAAARPLRVLLAEDNPVSQEVLRHRLHRLGHEVESVDDGKTAVAAVQRRRYDVVLIDCQMPRMDGCEATRRIRELDSGARDIHIIAMTAHAMQGDRERCLVAGMNDYLGKPFRSEELARALLRFTSGGADVDAGDPMS
jgi:signal transduction histidine kinase/CheY-like chemotaxis protein